MQRQRATLSLEEDLSIEDEDFEEDGEDFRQRYRDDGYENFIMKTSRTLI